MDHKDLFQIVGHKGAPSGDRRSIARDPVCGMSVDPDAAAAHHHYRGQTYFFCSLRCLQEFSSEPSKYLANASDQPVSDASSHRRRSQSADKSCAYTCPMHPEVMQPGPGPCPKCGMALEPMETRSPATRTTYTCPMHPEIVLQEPGSCPICGMPLERRTETREEEVNSELVAMSRRFWVGFLLTAPILLMTMAEIIPDHLVNLSLSARNLTWIQFLLATPVVLWGGWP